MKWAILTLNRQAIIQARILVEKIDSTVEIDIYTTTKYIEGDLKLIIGKIKDFSKVLMEAYPVIIYVMAMGIVVRSIAPYLRHKSVDSAVLCLSVDGQYIIPVLSGHLGGANQVAHQIADLLEAEPVITTASDILGRMAVDMFAKKHHLVIDSYEQAKKMTAMLIDEELVEIIGEIQLEEVSVRKEISPKAKGIILLSYKTDKSIMLPYVQLIPKHLVLGIGVRRGIALEQIEATVKEICETNYLSYKGIGEMASINLKADEVGLLELAKKWHIPFTLYTAKELATVVEQFDQSDFVRKITGVGAVSMPAGCLASKKGKCLVEKVAKQGVTVSIWVGKYPLN